VTAESLSPQNGGCIGLLGAGVAMERSIGFHFFARSKVCRVSVTPHSTQDQRRSMSPPNWTGQLAITLRGGLKVYDVPALVVGSVYRPYAPD